MFLSPCTEYTSPLSAGGGWTSNQIFKNAGEGALQDLNL